MVYANVTVALSVCSLFMLCGRLSKSQAIYCFCSRSGEALQPKGAFKMAKHHQGYSSYKHKLLPLPKTFPLCAKEKVI